MLTKVNANGQLQNYWLHNQLSRYSVSDVSWLGSLLVFVEFACSILAGRYFDIHGPQRLIRAGIVFAFGGVIALACALQEVTRANFSLQRVLPVLPGQLLVQSGRRRHLRSVNSRWSPVVPQEAVYSYRNHYDRGCNWRRHLSYHDPAPARDTMWVNADSLLIPAYRNTMITIACFNFALMLPAIFFMKA